MRRRGLLVLLALLSPGVALACAWDYDTIKMERSRFPSTLELITGKFLRHSPAFYQWRIDNRLKRLETDPSNVNLRDDLAVAYDKLGQHEKAIATALETEKLQPGRYETASNLGLFYFHADKLDESLKQLDKALAINPDAHFGREKYQKLLTEYVIRRRKGGPLNLPLCATTDSEGKLHFDEHRFNELFIHRKTDTLENKEEENKAAVKGVLGMMRFANHESPVLLEALGSLLRGKYPIYDDAKQLAARAYLQASYQVSEGPARNQYRTLADASLSMQVRSGSTSQMTLAEVEAEFQKELAEASEWYFELSSRETSWIRDGLDPEAEFDKLYVADPEVSGLDIPDPMPGDVKRDLLLGSICVGVSIMLIAGCYFSIRYVLRRWRRSRVSSAHQ